MKQADYIKISGAILRFPRKMCVFGAVNVAVTGHGVNSGLLPFFYNIDK